MGALRHRATTADERWSESYYFSFIDVAQNTSGFFRIGLEENAGCSNVWCAVFRDGKSLYQRFQFNLPYCAASLSYIAVGGLHLSIAGAGLYAICFEDRQLKIALRWESLHDEIDMHKAMGGLSDAVARGHGARLW